MYQKYISSIVESCTKDNSYVVLLKWNTIEEVHKKIQERSILLQKIGNIIEKYQFEQTNISFHKTGKLMLTNVDHIETLLSKLLR